MKQSRDQYYFETMARCAEFGRRAAAYLQESLDGFDTATLGARMEAMHAIEHDADMLKHDMMERLGREFMTPIELEDLVSGNVRLCCEEKVLSKCRKSWKTGRFLQKTVVFQ